MIVLKHSKSGWIVAGMFLLLATLAFLAHLYSITTDPGDSGESAVILIPFSSPWIFWVPDSIIHSRLCHWLAYPVFWGLTLLNAFFIYCLFGGLRWYRRKGD